ncbi:hypothetical protein FCU45_08835 [Sulfurimonas crateris]|uniref:Uncharacterized protein n=1 Tax=Sulfurimonas crateris TaxID=2574727 RepID=A0A4U2Z495_9BACT|nr:hypothetical protein [Sulfurimonas crateris]TKI69056.1 hypothetical protein FCU45_08835 [Sulfurimonas crateris]
MQELVEKLKGMKSATKAQYDVMIESHAYKEVIKNLKEAGLEKDDLSDEEFDALLSEQKKRANSFAKGALGASGIFLFLELLG